MAQVVSVLLRHGKQLVERILQALVGHGIRLLAVGLDKSGDRPGEKAGAEEWLPMGGAGSGKAAAAVQGGTDTVVKQIDNAVFCQEAEKVPVVIDVMRVFAADEPEWVFFTGFRNMAVFVLQDINHDIFFGMIEVIKGLSGYSGFPAEFADTDPVEALVAEQFYQCVRDLVQGGQRCFIFSAIHSDVLSRLIDGSSVKDTIQWSARII